MFKNSLIYLVLWFLIQLLIEVNCQSNTFKPSFRSLHTATYVDDKLYILGGQPDNGNLEKPGTQFFYLDVSVPFVNNQGLKWNDISNINIIPGHVAATTATNGINNTTFFLYGGSSSDGQMATVYTFDTRNNKWSVALVNYNIHKDSLKGIVNNGKMYLFSGLINGVQTNDMLIFDTINYIISFGNLDNAPSPRRHYGAALLDGQFIAYFGGEDFMQQLLMSEIYLYDTINDNWTIRLATGKIPINRSGFSTVLGYTGTEKDPNSGLYVLNLTSYEWSIPNVSGNQPLVRTWHRANVIGKYMVVTFGRYNFENLDTKINNDVLLLDISDNDEYKW
ncbi:8279_t:CDS:2, partial [Funneliformis caledonium]